MIYERVVVNEPSRPGAPLATLCLVDQGTGTRLTSCKYVDEKTRCYSIADPIQSQLKNNAQSFSAEMKYITARKKCYSFLGSDTVYEEPSFLSASIARLKLFQEEQYKRNVLETVQEDAFSWNKSIPDSFYIFTYHLESHDSTRTTLRYLKLESLQKNTHYRFERYALRRIVTRFIQRQKKK